MSEKIISQIQSAVTGEKYYIGTRGSVESVVVKLNSDNTDFSWGDLKVYAYIYDTTTKTVALTPDENGECTFEVQQGLSYSVKFPKITGFVQPETTYNYTAKLAVREITKFYSSEIDYETVEISVSVVSNNQDSDILDGQTITINGNDGTTYTATFSGVKAQCKIPYGTTYSIEFPEIAGFYHNLINNSFVAGQAFRGVNVVYQNYGTDYLYGLDENGNAYIINDNGLWQKSEEGSTELSKETAAETIKAIVFNPQALAEAPREGGTGVGCGFMIKVDDTIVVRQWAVENVDYYSTDETKGSPYLTNVTNNAEGLKKTDGELYTSEMIRVSYILHKTLIETNPDLIPSPAATYCRNQSITINNIQKQGFLPAYGQLMRLIQNRIYLDIAYAAMNKLPPNITVDYWWTSCQTNNVWQVIIRNAEYDKHNKNANVGHILPCYDII